LENSEILKDCTREKSHFAEKKNIPNKEKLILIYLGQDDGRVFIFIELKSGDIQSFNSLLDITMSLNDTFPSAV
jgi:hypothetical protein